MVRRYRAPVNCESDMTGAALSAAFLLVGIVIIHFVHLMYQPSSSFGDYPYPFQHVGGHVVGCNFHDHWYYSNTAPAVEQFVGHIVYEREQSDSMAGNDQDP